VIDNESDENWERELAEEEADRTRKAEVPPKLTRDEFLAWRAPRKGISHAERLDNPLWHWLVRTRWNAYHANNTYGGPSSIDAGPMWCFERFGKSETLLPDGRVAHIGGEHEDHYDPDFFIYNDVIVTDSTGGIAIYGYPDDDFPPTDFHSATLVGNAIFIIGCLGYPDRRVLDSTPVFALALDTMRISRIETQGQPPGWIYRHSAALAGDGRSVVISGGERWLGPDRAMNENIDSWSLDTLTGEWIRLTQNNWQRWTIRRVDRKGSRLWDVRQALWHRDHAHLGIESYWRFDDAPDFAALEQLYRVGPDTPAPTQGSDFNVFTTVLDGLTVRFKEERSWVEAIVEGRLPEDRLAALQQQTLVLMARLEGSACEIERFGST
jgi:hypothetical protein